MHAVDMFSRSMYSSQLSSISLCGSIMSSVYNFIADFVAIAVVGKSSPNHGHLEAAALHCMSQPEMLNGILLFVFVLYLYLYFQATA